MIPQSDSTIVGQRTQGLDGLTETAYKYTCQDAY